MPKDIQYLVDGYQTFRNRYFNGQNPLYDKLVKFGQKPKILMIACSDSRVDPAIILNCEPGDLFVIRNVANLIPPYETSPSYHGTSAAMEFGITGLGIKHIVVFGHTQCGGLSSLVERTCSSNVTPQTEHSFLSKWMEIAQPSCEYVHRHYSHLENEAKVEICGELTLIQSLHNLHTFPWIQERVANGSLFLHAWNFHLDSGIIRAYNPLTSKFEHLVEQSPFSEILEETISSSS